MKRILVLLVLSIQALLPLPAWAEASVDSDGGEIRLRCGGIGDEESEPMRAEAGRHALMILFADAERSWIADVATRIEDPFTGVQAEALCGPVALVDVMRPGRYRIVATYDGHSQEQWVTLKPGGGARIVLRWLQ
jgi:hypothetical protein